MKKYLGSERTLIHQILKKGKGLTDELIQEPSILLRLLRRQLGMTQVQLARKSGIKQTNIASIESGKKNPTLTTLNKLFEAMGYRLAMIPIGPTTPDRIIQNQARKLAEENLHDLFATMALENQTPSTKKMNELIEEESFRLMESEPKSIWDD